jgi:thiamine-monophosphate kinase
MGELSLLEQFRAGAPGHPWLAVGPGQDCAILRWPSGRDMAFKIDQLVEGTHFTLTGPEAASPARIGWKAMAKACSDIAAAGFWPVAATVAVNLRKGTDERLALELYSGLAGCCKHYAFALAGGDLSVSEQGLALSVSLLGEGPQNGAWLRSGAQPGDILFCTGSLGGSRARKHLDFLPRLEEARQIRNLIPTGVHACIDITDGLSRDLRHICAESRCGAAIYAEQIPLSPDTGAFSTGKNARDPLAQALGDGEDFELLLAVEPAAAEILAREWHMETKLTCIGNIQEDAKGCLLIAHNGSSRPLPDIGYEHLL